MEIIRPMMTTFKQVLGTQKIKPEQRYRQQRFCVELPVCGQVLRFNLLTQEIVLDDGAGMEEDREFWIAHWFLVPEDEDEQKIFEQLRLVLSMMRRRKQTNYTIMTTLACNARCAYCYEQGRKQTTMSRETAQAVTAFIDQTRVSERVQLAWFGGEPLMNDGVIDEICRGLSEKQIDYTSGMTTNGLLFDDAMITKAVSLWHLKSVQITLDGTKVRYQQIKNYQGIQTQAFERVTDGIEALARAGVQVQIRMNLGLDNYEDLTELCDWLKHRYEGISGISVYPSMLYEDPLRPYSDDERRQMFEQYKALEDLVAQLKIGTKRVLRTGIKTNHCMADDDGSYTITPDGMLTGCQHFTDTEILGNVRDGLTELQLAGTWKQRTPSEEACRSCRYYPMCFRLLKCPIESVQCTTYDRALRGYIVEKTMLKAYEAWREKEK